MVNTPRAQGQLSLGFLLLLLFPALAFAQPGAVFPSSGVDRGTIQLSESARLTLTLEGPAPLRVELPKEPDKLLTPESATVWHIRPAGPPAVTPLPEDGRDRWTQTFRVSPFVPGKKVTLAFGPVKVTAGTDLNPQDVTFPAKEVRVQTAITDAKPDNARPVTRIEELPTPPTQPPEAMVWPFLLALGAVFAAVLVAGVIRRARAKPPPLPPGEWALRELDRVERDGLAGRAVADRVAAVLREYVERRHGLLATKLTTTELLVACEAAGWPTERTGPLGEVLERCDRAKFAGDEPDAGEAAELVVQAREWVASSPPTAVGRL
jgi:hypothetical protein